MTARVFISQSDRFSKNHGQVFRSSGMFYYRASQRFRTTITLWNHFKHKNNCEAAILASVRDMSGKLLARERLGFESGEVLNYSPLAGEDFEGSVEIEAFSAQNLKIPFTAISALYEAEKSVSLLHAYGRVYSSHEIEEARTIPVGREIGWTLRDSEGVRSFCVFHNGAAPQPAQKIHLRIRNAAGNRRACEIALTTLAPFETIRIVAADHISGLAGFLGGREGTAALDFQVNGAFTRMMVGNETTSGDEFQVTHSNFNYADHVSEALPDSVGEAFMVIPDLGGRNRRVIVYPEFQPGAYVMTTANKQTSFEPGDLVIAPVGTETVAFSRRDGALPARIVTGLIIDSDGARLPSEISLNVFHARKPDKRLSWGACASSERLTASLVATDFTPVKGAFPANSTMEVRAYSAVNHDVLTVKLGATDMSALSKGIPFDDLFPGLAAHLGGETGYYTLYSDYGGLFCYTMLRKSGSVSLEHSF
jgi:hypothetical protein